MTARHRSETESHATLALEIPVLGADVQAPAVGGADVLDSRVAGSNVGVGWPRRAPALT